MIDALCICGRPRHRGICSARYKQRLAELGTPPITKQKIVHRRSPHRRFHQHFGVGNPLVLKVDNPAVLDGRTHFPTRVVPAHVQDRLLKSGEHQRKIGSHVTKGKLAGAPIFTLTLEERATCPRSCRQWRSCYGNGMPWSLRIQPDDTLLDRLSAELAELNRRYRRFLVRLHVLGDFYSVEYVDFWRQMVAQFPALHIFGYTARRGDDISDAIDRLCRSPRVWIRRSDGPPREFRAIVVDKPEEAKSQGAILCPAQSRHTVSCGSCALCWATPKTIAFLVH